MHGPDWVTSNLQDLLAERKGWAGQACLSADALCRRVWLWIGFRGRVSFSTECVMLCWRAFLLSEQDSLLVNKMAESGAEGELPPRRLVVKEQKNGEATGKNKVHLIQN